mmetsp:Transcript_23374/g.47718  ORF Transcript_23374/g.47718 Transcript_23374/m.47718 type:complete len:247 (-) Transcript_23374:1712-2452(-)
MVEKLNFPSKEEAQKIRDEYFKIYHSTAKGLTAAEKEGRLPEGVTFNPADLDQYWASNLDFSLLGGPDPKCIESFHSITSQSGYNLDFVAFSNGPRKYVSRVLKEIGLDIFFPPDKLFAVTDVLPYCKPEKDAFELVLKAVGASPESCVMVEDSMKNIRIAKSMGMKTILVCGKGRRRRKHGGVEEEGTSVGQCQSNTHNAEATKAGDTPDETDPAVDAVVEVASEIGDVLKQWMINDSSGQLQFM